MTRPFRQFVARGVVATIALCAVTALALAGAAFAATNITEPTGNPYHVALDASGRPVAFTVVASGFPEQTPVFVEQCNDRKPSQPDWSPTFDCDLATSQAPAIADAQGVVRFDASDPSLALRAFGGASPQELFNCLAPNAKSPANGLPDFHRCQIRVSSNPAHTTDDQVFLPIVLGSGASASTSKRSSRTPLLVGVGALAVLAVATAGVVAARRRPARSRSSGLSSERSAEPR